MRTLFALTAREAALAASLASGRSIRETAEDTRVAYSTPRTHLDSVFSKDRNAPAESACCAAEEPSAANAAIISPATSSRLAVWLIGLIAFETPPSPAFAGGTSHEPHVIFLAESLARMEAALSICPKHRLPHRSLGRCKPTLICSEWSRSNIRTGSSLRPVVPTSSLSRFHHSGSISMATIRITSALSRFATSAPLMETTPIPPTL